MSEIYKAAWTGRESEFRAAAMEADVTFVADVDTDAFRAACRPIWDQLRENDPTAWAVAERIRDF